MMGPILSSESEEGREEHSTCGVPASLNPGHPDSHPVGEQLTLTSLTELTPHDAGFAVPAS